jgi:molybdopterin synthase catalytic subunit
MLVYYGLLRREWEIQPVFSIWATHYGHVVLFYGIVRDEDLKFYTLEKRIEDGPFGGLKHFI